MSAGPQRNVVWRNGNIAVRQAVCNPLGLKAFSSVLNFRVMDSVKPSEYLPCCENKLYSSPGRDGTDTGPSRHVKNEPF